MAKQPEPSDDHEHDDHCICDIDLRQDEITSDADLPVAAGGVASAPAVQPADAAPAVQPADDADGCEINFNEAAPTGDDELPVATGGVA